MKGTCGVVLLRGGSYADSRLSRSIQAWWRLPLSAGYTSTSSPPAVLGSREVRRRKVLVGWGKQEANNKAGALP